MEHGRPTLDELRSQVKRAAKNSPEDTYRRAGYDGELKTQSDRLLGLCPFHAEKMPSFTIYPDGGFHCFGCGAYGDIIDFHQRRSMANFREAVTSLARDLGIEVGSTPTRASERTGVDEPWTR